MGKAPRSLTADLDQFDDRVDEGGGSMHSGSQSVLTQRRASRRANAVAGDYASAMRADAAIDDSFQSAKPLEVKGHRCLFAAASPVFRKLLYDQTTFRVSGHGARVQLSPAVTPAGFTVVRDYIYKGTATLQIDSAVEVAAAAAVLGLENLLRETVAYIKRSLHDENLFNVRRRVEARSKLASPFGVECSATEAAALVYEQVLLEADRYVRTYAHTDGVYNDCIPHCTELLECCERYFSENAETLVHQDDFMLLASPTLESLAQRDDLAIPELHWFKAVLKWTQFDRSGCVTSASRSARPARILTFLVGRHA